MIYYHVCKRWDGNDIIPLVDKCNNNQDMALKKFNKKYPNGIGLGEEHIYWVHMWDSLSNAIACAVKMRGQILKVNDVKNILTIKRDTLEFDHPMTKCIPSSLIVKVGGRRRIRCGICHGTKENERHFDCDECWGMGYTTEYFI